MAKKPSPLKNLETLPSSSDIYLWADYLELLCLASKDGRLSRSEALDFIRERARDLKEGKPLEGDEAEDEAIEVELGLETEDITEDRSDTEVANDKWEKRGNSWFDHLEYRAVVFADFYPFTIQDGNVLILRRKKISLTLKHKSYVFFLLASNLRYFSGQDKTSIASLFEIVSYHALSTYLPHGSTVHLFGKHALNAGRYSGLLWDKLNILAADIKEEVRCKKSSFKPTNTGDAGLDLVAWLPLEPGSDFAPGFLLVFGQCACTMEWVRKQYETHYDTWSNWISFTVYPMRLTFIPFCFRGADGNWYNQDKMAKTVVVDRVRLIHLLREKQQRIKEYLIQHVDEVLQHATPAF